MRINKIQSILIVLLLSVETIVVPMSVYGVQSVSENAVAEIETVETDGAEEEMLQSASEEVPAEKATIKYSGKNNELDWSIDTNGHFTLSGEGNYKSGHLGADLEWLQYSDEIITAEISVKGNTNFAALFLNCNRLESVDFLQAETGDLVNICNMFDGCRNLKEIDFSGCDLRKVYYAQFAFRNCSSLKNIEFGERHPQILYDPYNMFDGCSSLTYLDLSKITIDALILNSMFQGCSSLKELKMGNFDESPFEMYSVFEGCSGLENLDLGNLDTQRVSEMSCLFKNCSSLKNIVLSNFDTSRVEKMASMFEGCSSLENLDLDNFKTEKVTTMGYMFSGCSSLEKLNISGFDTSNVTTMSSMFSGCRKLKELDLSHFKTDNVTNMNFMFSGCNNLERLTIDGFNTEHVTNMSFMFSECNNLKTVPTEKLNTGMVTNMNSMFSGCRSIESIDLSHFDIDQVTNISGMMDGCSNLIVIASPKNVLIDITLPNISNCVWKDASGNICEKMHKEQSTAVRYSRYYNMASNVVEVSSIPEQIYTGRPIIPLPTVSYQGNILKKDVDYTLSYANNVNPGMATIIITGKGNYTGVKRVNFSIYISLEKASIDKLNFTYQKGNTKKLNSKLYYKMSLEFKPVSLSKKYEISIGNSKGKKVKSIFVNCENRSCVTKTIKNLTEGIYRVQIRAINDAVYSEWSLPIYVIRQPRAQARFNKKNVQIKWEKINGATGYDIYLCESKHGKYKKVASVGKNTTIKTVKKYKKKKLSAKTYYYYVVAKKKVEGKTYKSDKEFVYKVVNK